MLVIEIAVSSAEVDRRKVAIYAKADVTEYWIILPETRQIETYIGLDGEQYAVRRLFSVGQAVCAEVLPTFQVRLDDIFPR